MIVLFVTVLNHDHMLTDESLIGFDQSSSHLQSSQLPAFCSCSIVNVVKITYISTSNNPSLVLCKIMMLLSTLSYSKHAKQEFIQTLLTFATIPKPRTLQPPSYAVFQLSEGYRLVLERLVSVTEGHARPFNECPSTTYQVFRARIGTSLRVHIAFAA